MRFLVLTFTCINGSVLLPSIFKLLLYTCTILIRFDQSIAYLLFGTQFGGFSILILSTLPRKLLPLLRPLL